jgi:hypothetical protein
MRKYIVSFSALTGLLFGIATAASTQQRTYLAAIQAPPPRSGSVYPPNGLQCILQTGAAVAYDPDHSDFIFACEAKNGHGAIAWEGDKLLVDSIEGSPTRMAAGSVNLNGPVDPHGTMMVSVRTDGGIAWRYLP